MKKILSMVIIFGMLLCSILANTVVFAEEGSVINKNQDIESLHDLKLNPGQLNMDEIPDKLRLRLERRIREIDKYLEELSEAKVRVEIMEQKKINDAYSAHNEAILKNAKDRYLYLDNHSYEIAGIIKMEENGHDDLISISSSEFDVTTDKPSVYYEPDMGMYVMLGGWKWNKMYPDSTVGGPDGFGLRNEHERITVIEMGLRTYDERGTVYYHSDFSPETSAYGVGMRFQDSWINYDARTYNAYRGSGWAYFTFYDGYPSGKTVTFNATYAHSWKSTSLTGFSIGKSSFGLSWSSSKDRWDRPNYNSIKF